MSKESQNWKGSEKGRRTSIKPRAETITKISIGSVKSGKQSAPPPPTAEKGIKSFIAGDADA